MASHSSGTPLYQLICIQLGHLPLYQLTCIQFGHLPQPFLPVSSLGIFHSQSFEFLVHGLVEALPQEEGPEAKHGVHLL